MFDDGVQLGSRQPPAITAMTSLFDHVFRDIIAIALPLLVGMNRAQPGAGFIEDEPGEQMLAFSIPRAASGRGLCRQQSLGPVKEVGINDRLVFSGIELIAMPDLTDVDRVGQQVVQVAAPERLSRLAVN